jgi:AcrR family transcriptional regulator
MPAPRREHLLDTAESLFSKKGFKGVSVDRLLNEAGVAKMTLYKGFESKNALILETLRRRAVRLAAHMETYLAKAGPTPQEQLLCCFDAMREWSTRPDFNGCYFINALGEYAGDDSEVAIIVRAYKAGFLDRLEELCSACEIDDSTSIAKSILLLVDGAVTAHMTLNDQNSYERAKEIARILLRQG